MVKVKVTVKIKLPLYTPWRHRAGLDEYIHSFLALLYFILLHSMLIVTNFFKNKVHNYAGAITASVVDLYYHSGKWAG